MRERNRERNAEATREGFKNFATALPQITTHSVFGVLFDLAHNCRDCDAICLLPPVPFVNNEKIERCSTSVAALLILLAIVFRITCDGSIIIICRVYDTRGSGFYYKNLYKAKTRKKRTNIYVAHFPSGASQFQTT